VGVNGQYKLLNWRIFQQPSSKAVAISTCCFYCTLIHNSLLVLGYIKSRYAHSHLWKSTFCNHCRLVVIPSTDPVHTTKKTISITGSIYCIEAVSYFCLQLLSKYFSFTINTWRVTLLMRSERYLSYPILSKIGVRRTLNFNLKKSFSSSYILAARRRGLFRSYNGIAKVSGVTSQNAWNVRHGEANRRIFKLFTAIVRT